MKIKTITCHDVYNYGAALQAYALQTYLQAQGHDVEIIDYKPDYMRVHYKFWYIPKNSHYYERAMNSWLLRFMLCCYFAPKRFATLPRKFKFDSFVKHYLRLTRRYNSYQELADYPPEADLYLAGSDQIWNSTLPNGKDPGYFLQFGNDSIKRIAYAASFAIPEIEKGYEKLNRQWLSEFDAISVREHTGLSIIKSLGLEAEEVVDPVFLLTQNKWSEFSSEKRLIKQKYILVYDLCLNDNRIKDEAERLAKIYGMKIIAVDGALKCPYAQRNISNAGPIEFVNLIKNANFVVTNSFHALAFSVIFNRSFSVFYKQKNISRMVDFLHHVGLSECLNSDSPQYDFAWNRVNTCLHEMCQSSYLYLFQNVI